MNKRNVPVEILPRALWVVQGICLYSGQHFTHRPPVLTDNTVFLCVGAILMFEGSLFWMYVGYYMRRALFNKELVTGGPFKYVRHPMYVSIYIMLFGIGLLFFSWTWFAIMVVFMPVWYLDCRTEEKQMRGLHGREYLSYKRRVGMFIPKVR